MTYDQPTYQLILHDPATGKEVGRATVLDTHRLNAGDEIALRFPVSPAPPAGFKRDFIFVSDGWEKDGNFNSLIGSFLEGFR